MKTRNLSKYLGLSLATLPLFLSACMSDAGIKVANMGNKQQMTHTAVAFGTLRLNEEVAGSYKAFLGEYQVEESWNNNLFHIDKVVIEERNNKIIVLTYPKGWQIPNQKTEFTGCQVVNERRPTDYGISFTEQTLLCVSSTGNPFKGHSSVEMAKTTDKTIGKAEIPVSMLNVLLPAKDIKITTPYAIRLDLWDELKPLLAVREVK